MTMFTIGPVEMYPSTKSVRLNDFVHFRTAEFSELVKDSLIRLSKLLGNNEPNSLIYFAASGTAVMEATVENCVNDTDKVLVINGGAFGHRFCELLDFHGKSFNSIDLNWNETLTSEHLIPYEKAGYTMLFVNLHETHTGQLYDIKMLSDFCKRNNMMLVVDAISTFLADEYDMGAFGVDVTLISSQKGLCLSPGMSFVSLSKRMIDKIQSNENIASKYFDFKDYLKNIVRGQTPYTPPVLVMYELKDMLDLIDKEGGLYARISNVQEKAVYFRNKALELGFKMPDYPISNALTPIICENVSAYDIFTILKDKHNIYVNPCGGDLANVLLRVSHIGNTSIDDIDMLFEKLLLSINELKNKELVHDRQ